MSFNGSGAYSLPSGNPVVTGTSISSTWANSTLSDIATALTNALCKDGQSTPTANLKMGGYKFTGLGAGSASGDSARFEQLFSQGAPTDIASAATVDIGAQNTNFLTVTGTTTITSFGTNYNGPKMLRFSGALTLTHNATTLVLPGAANITTAAGDTCIVVPKSTSSGTADGWAIISYQIAAGGPAKYIRADSTNNLTAGYTATSYSAGTKSTGTFTPDPVNGNVQHYTNGGAHTLAPPASVCSIVLEILNNASAGTITTSGFTKVVGTAPDTTNGNKFVGVITKTNSYSMLSWQALQ